MYMKHYNTAQLNSVMRHIAHSISQSLSYRIAAPAPVQESVQPLDGVFGIIRASWSSQLSTEKQLYITATVLLLMYRDI